MAGFSKVKTASQSVEVKPGVWGSEAQARRLRMRRDTKGTDKAIAQMESESGGSNIGDMFRNITDSFSGMVNTFKDGIGSIATGFTSPNTASGSERILLGNTFGTASGNIVDSENVSSTAEQADSGYATYVVAGLGIVVAFLLLTKRGKRMLKG